MTDGAPLANARTAQDLVSRPWARATWYSLGLLAIVASFDADHRVLLWTLAFGASGVMCVVNAVRARRFHCMYTGPIYLVGAATTILRGVGATSLPWAWIGAGVFFGVVGALAWERARCDASTTNRCC